MAARLGSSAKGYGYHLDIPIRYYQPYRFNALILVDCSTSQGLGELYREDAEATDSNDAYDLSLASPASFAGCNFKGSPMQLVIDGFKPCLFWEGC